jgi:hypothetical protein
VHVRKLLALTSTAAVALLGATAGQPASRSSGIRTLKTAAQVTGLAADGSRAAVSTACGAHEYELLAWNPVRRSVVSMAPRRQRECYGASTGEGIYEGSIAGRRLAWVPYSGGNYQQAWLVTATIRKPLSTRRLTETKDRNTGDGVGAWVGNIHGDGPLLVFNTWTVCEKFEYADSCPEGTPPGYHIYNENLWRIVGQRKRLLVASPDELNVLSVAAGRILVQREDGSLELRRGADGGLLLSFPFRRGDERAAVLDASELVVLDRVSGRHWRVYDPVSGAQKRVLHAPAGAIPADVERGMLVYTVGRVVHVLRLADGRESTFVAPRVKIRYEHQYVLAQIEPSGLFYSYSVRDSVLSGYERRRTEGRVRFVPFDQIRFR